MHTESAEGDPYVQDNTGKRLNMRGSDDLRITGKPGDARLTYTMHNHKPQILIQSGACRLEDVERFR